MYLYFQDLDIETFAIRCSHCGGPWIRPVGLVSIVAQGMFVILKRCGEFLIIKEKVGRKIMGLIKAAKNAIGSTLRDQYKEYFECPALSKDV